MDKVLYLRGEKDYWLNPAAPVLYRTKLHIDKEKIIADLPSQKTIDLWNDTLNLEYFYFRKMLRDMSLSNTKKINYFDIILYNDQEYEDFINTQQDFVIFPIDDDDFILPEIHKLIINPGINVFLYYSFFFWKGHTRLQLPEKAEKIKSSHFCYQNDDDRDKILPALHNHRRIQKYVAKNVDKVHFHKQLFSLYMWHPSSLSFLRTMDRHWNFIGKTSVFTYKEQQNILRLLIIRSIRIMEYLCHAEKHRPFLSSIKELYKGLC